MVKCAYPLFLSLVIVVFSGMAQAQETPCNAKNQTCLTDHILSLAEEIDDRRWKDQTYREVAKTMAASGRATDALPLISKIQSPDTKALTIRGIGMEAAMAGRVPENLFMLLRTEAEKITDPPSYGIALTYIAMAQAFAEDDAGAIQTASEMKNEALRHKAYGETAEIQAEKGKYDLAMQSIAAIESIPFKNKAYKNVSKIFAESEKYQDAFNTTLYITNPVITVEAIQFILDTQRQSKERAGK